MWARWRYILYAYLISFGAVPALVSMGRVAFVTGRAAPAQRVLLANVKKTASVSSVGRRSRTSERPCFTAARTTASHHLPLPLSGQVRRQRLMPRNSPGQNDHDNQHAQRHNEEQRPGPKHTHQYLIKHEAPYRAIRTAGFWPKADSLMRTCLRRASAMISILAQYGMPRCLQESQVDGLIRLDFAHRSKKSQDLSVFTVAIKLNAFCVAG